MALAGDCQDPRGWLGPAIGERSSRNRGVVNAGSYEVSEVPVKETLPSSLGGETGATVLGLLRAEQCFRWWVRK